MALDGAPGGIKGRIETVLYQGERTECLVRVGDQLITIYGPPETAGLRHRDVTLVLPEEAMSLWPK
ncbi:MAG: hypothetical protein RL477_1199, partial [Pseudomonadota bacterium]